MNALGPGDLVPGASVVASRRVHDRFVTASSSNQSYSHITASGSSRVHNGNNYYITYDCLTGHCTLPTSPSDQQTTVEYVSRSSQKRKRPVSDAPGIPCDSRERQTLVTVLESLGQYSTSIQQQSKGEQSTRIAAQLAIVLEHFEQAAMEPFRQAALDPFEQAAFQPSEENASDERTTAVLDRQLQDLKYQLRRATSIKINAISPKAHPSRQYKAQSKLKRITWGRWEISLCTKTLRSRSVDGQMLTETCSALNVQNAVGSRGPCIAAYFGESVDLDRTITMYPIVLAYNQVNDDAKVLELVKDDDLDGLMRHLVLGQASIRDCDEEGRSLLHYACHHGSEATCKFLVDSGCDLDRTALTFFYNKSRNTPLSEYGFFNAKADDRFFERSLMCRKHLLQAGADPTLGQIYTLEGSESTPALIEALNETYEGSCTTEPFELILREGTAFFDVRSFRAQGQSLWMHACSMVGFLSSPKILHILVQAGAMVAEVDDDGWNCLFNCVGHASVYWNSDEFEALRFLLTVFEDICARDFKGRTIFDVVADSEELFSSYRRGSYRQDLWYCALFRSGLAQRFNIPLHPGQLIFDDDYSEGHYRALLYLDTWEDDSQKQPYPDYSLVDKDALSEQDRETAPGLREWNTSDLLVMEERISQAIDLNRYGGNVPAHSMMTDSLSEAWDEWVSEDEEQEEDEDSSF